MQPSPRKKNNMKKNVSLLFLFFSTLFCATGQSKQEVASLLEKAPGFLRSEIEIVENESRKKHASSKEYETWLTIYVEPDKYDEEYAAYIHSLIPVLYPGDKNPYKIILTVREDNDIVSTHDNKKGICLFYYNACDTFISYEDWTYNAILDDIRNQILWSTF